MSEAEEAIVRELYAAKARHEHKTAYCTAAVPLLFRRWNKQHPVEENTVEETIPEGTTLKIVMVSRFDDAGLTDDLDAMTGYHCRVSWDHGSIKDIRWHAAPEGESHAR